MKSNFYNKEKAEEEAKEKKAKGKEGDIRKKYLESLKNNKLFQKYVMREIIEAEIESNQGIGGDIETMALQDSDTVKSLLVGKLGALKSSQNIKNKIAN